MRNFDGQKTLSFSEGDSTNYQKSAARFFLTVDVTSENGK